MNEIELLMGFIKEERKRQGISQVNLAKKASINEKYYGEIERGESIPTIKKVIALCNALDIKISLNDFKIN